MEPILQERLPYPLPDTRLPGIRPCSMDEWLCVDEAFAAQMALRDRLIATRRDRVLAMNDGARAAAHELLGVVVAQLRGHPGYRVGAVQVTRPDGVRVRLDADAPLAVLGRLVQEDFCLLEKPGGQVRAPASAAAAAEAAVGAGNGTGIGAGIGAGAGTAEDAAKARAGGKAKARARARARAMAQTGPRTTGPQSGKEAAAGAGQGPGPGPSGAHVLSGAVLCFPASWSLAEKMNRPLGLIHAPVAQYDALMARRVQRLLDAIRPGQPLWRANANAQLTGDLFAPMTEAEARRRKPVPPDAPYLRSERQCLVRLPRTGAVVFSIHTYMLERASVGDQA